MIVFASLSSSEGEKGYARGKKTRSEIFPKILASGERDSVHAPVNPVAIADSFEAGQSSLCVSRDGDQKSVRRDMLSNVADPRPSDRDVIKANENDSFEGLGWLMDVGIVPRDAGGALPFGGCLFGE